MLVLVTVGALPLWRWAGLPAGARALRSIGLRSRGRRLGMTGAVLLPRANRIELLAVTVELVDEKALRVDDASLLHHQQRQQRQGDQ